MRFLHAADVHLDSPLRGLDRYEGAPVELLRNASREALARLVQLAVVERVDFVILAGDLYDGDWQDYNTGVFFVQRMRELERAGIPVFLIRGNHDAQSRITSQLSLPANVHSFSTEQPETRTLDKLRVALHGQGFANQAEPRNLVLSYPQPLASHFNIGVLHTSLTGREDHDSYAPCTVDDLVNRHYDYWALGHVHKRETVRAQRPRIEFPGNVQGRHVKETGAKGCLLVTVHGQQITTEFRPLDVIRWDVVRVNAAEAESFEDLLGQLQTSLAAAIDDAEGRLLAARLVITCTDVVRIIATADPAKLRAELVARFEKELWIEKIQWQQIRQVAAAAPLLSDDATSELQAVLAELQQDVAAAQQMIATGECEKLLRNLPADLRALLPEAWPEIVSRAEALLQPSGEEQPA